MADLLAYGENVIGAVGQIGGGSQGGGHTIEDNSGTDMTQRESLQFVGVYTEDDSTNDRTKVNVVREMTKAQMEALPAAQKVGFIKTTDEPDNPYGVHILQAQIAANTSAAISFTKEAYNTYLLVVSTANRTSDQSAVYIITGNATPIPLKTSTGITLSDCTYNSVTIASIYNTCATMYPLF